MKTEGIQRPKWDVDRRLEANLGKDIRVAAAAFRPIDYHGKPGPRWISLKDLILPDNTQATDLPVFFEGKLEAFLREVAVVTVRLGSRQRPRSPVNGTIHFRGGRAVVLQGPVEVRLAYPFSVEQLPVDSDNYWSDLRRPLAQFTFSFVEVPVGKPPGRIHCVSQRSKTKPKEEV